jgi:hypothetical protein
MEIVNKICPNCKSIFSVKRRNKDKPPSNERQFCSRSCGSVRNFTNNSLKKISNAATIREWRESLKLEFTNLRHQRQLKILSMMKLGCFLCGWNESICDMHHIDPKSKGGNSNMDNITYVCPNCHRKIHRSIVKEHIPSMKEKIGDKWKDYYHPDNFHISLLRSKN